MSTLSLMSAATAVYFIFSGTDYCTLLSCTYSKPVLFAGALFYLAVGLTYLLSYWGRFRTPLLLTGIGTHIALLCYGYFTSGGLCPVCLVYASVTALLTAGNFLAKKGLRLCFVLAAMIFLTMAGLTWSSSAGESQSIPTPATNIATQDSQEPDKQAGTTTANEDNLESVVVKSNAPVSEDSAAPTEDRVPEPTEQRIPVQPEKPVTITVQQVEGSNVNLDISKKPALLFAPECPACRKVLSCISGLTNKPYLVSVFYHGEAEKVRIEMAQEGMAGEEFYILPKPPVKKVPALLYCEDGEMEVEIGDTAVENFLKAFVGHKDR